MVYVWYTKFWMDYVWMFKSWNFLVIKKKILFERKKKFKNPWVPMNTHGYLNTYGYPHSGYSREYGTDTSIIYIQQDGDGYHTIFTYG